MNEGSLECEADVIMFIHRNEESIDFYDTTLSIRKNRRGPTTSFLLDYDRIHNSYSEKKLEYVESQMSMSKAMDTFSSVMNEVNEEDNGNE